MVFGLIELRFVDVLLCVSLKGYLGGCLKLQFHKQQNKCLSLLCDRLDGICNLSFQLIFQNQKCTDKEENLRSVGYVVVVFCVCFRVCVCVVRGFYYYF